MKYLIAISSCEAFESNGFNQAMRDTWLADLSDPQFKDIDYRFFVGHGANGFGNTSEGYTKNDPRCKYDMVQVDCEDAYTHVTYKTQASLRWANEHGYDFVFRCFPDTYVRLDRLMACGFRDFDYYGDFRGSADWPGYASGGAGYWLSRKAYQRLLSAPILGIGRDDIMMRVEDLWVGHSLPQQHATRFDDQRFKNTRDDCPSKDNDFVTAHLSYISCNGQLKAELYNPTEMFAAHKPWRQA